MTTLLLLKGDTNRVRPPRIEEDDRIRHGGSRIRCPRCGWKPESSERETQCRRCLAWSPHDEWYAEE
jgi:hypothetical protein